MKKAIKSLIFVSLVGLILSGYSATILLGKAEYTKKEHKACTVCHVKNGSKELNDVGKCYAKNHTLSDCQTSDKK